MRGISLDYLGKRVLAFLVVIVVAASINFVIPRLAPGNPIGAMSSRLQEVSAGIEGGEEMFKAYRELFGLDEPLWQQYLKYLGNFLTFRFGYSLSSFPSSVWDVIRPSIMWTIGLLTASILISFFLGIAAGALAAWQGTPRPIRMFAPVTMLFAVLPYFLIALLLLYLLAFNNHILPARGAYGSDVARGFNLAFFASAAKHAVLPGLSIVLSSLGLWALGMRGLMINTLGEDYMTLAEAKGLPKRRILWWYAIRNAVPPQLTVLAIAVGHVVSGAILVEVVFAYPGLGYLLFQSISFSDYTVTQGITYILVLSVGLTVLLIDLIYPRLDPRVTYVAR